ncbi:hypothetical protein C8R43DRAFT_1132381 [Mycena crocata]|nr:hypothetical protein C8R43DRAFT_1132381 [Mycena crocata]
MSAPPTEDLALGSLPVVSLSGRAAAQARYRAKNADAEREKAKLRMRRLREQRKEIPTKAEPDVNLGMVLPGLSATNEAILNMTREELWASDDFKEFTEYCNRVKIVKLTFDADDPQEVEDFKKFMASNPCVEDLPPYDEEGVEWVYWCHLAYGNYPEWKEELADYRDIITEMSPEQLDKAQLEARARILPHTLLARGGF